MPLMATKRHKPYPLFIREWRKFTKIKAVDLALALNIERESYYRLERSPHKFNNEEMDLLAYEMGIRPSQFWFPPPPVAGAEKPISWDEAIQDIPANMHEAAFLALRGMAGK